MSFDLFSTIPPQLLNFLTVALFGFVIGLEQREYNISEGKKTFGSTRTYTFIALFGFILYSIDVTMLSYIVGLSILTIFLTFYYIHKLKLQNGIGFVEIFTALLTYLLTPVSVQFEKWFLILFVVTVIMLLGSKKKISHLVSVIDHHEVITFAKFLIVSGVVLPLIPKIPFYGLPVTPYQAWVAVVVISAISYFGYILQTYFLKNKGMLLLGVIGGIYSSTATTVVLAKKAKENPLLASSIAAAIVVASMMMYLRLLGIILLFNREVFSLLVIPFLLLAVLSGTITIIVQKLSLKQKILEEEASVEQGHNPLELQTALVFAGLFVFVSWLTEFIVSHYGAMGLNILSLVVGATDIDPFILSLLQGKFSVSSDAIAGAILLAVASNNLLKALYSLLFSGARLAKQSVSGLIILALATFLTAFLV